MFAVIKMWYKNIAGGFSGLVTKHACDRRTDRITTPIAASRGNNNHSGTVSVHFTRASDFYGRPGNRADHYIFILSFVMVALWNRADHYIFALWFLLSFFFYFTRLISAIAEWMSAILARMVWP